ncbi:MAG: hypothetical protein MTP17_00420 [Candidatus Midichloria sp.]|nr:MAG: hypothetical protein MTP17_00420 [Candidatus Midichloria sp.]
MIRILVVILISLIPIFIYCALYNKAKKEAIARSLPIPSFMNENLLKAFIQFLVLASIFFIIFIILSLYIDSAGEYVPATVIDGQIVKGHVIKKQ